MFQPALLADTLLTGAYVCAAVFVVASWRRLPRTLLQAGPWLLIGIASLVVICIAMTKRAEAVLRILESLEPTQVPDLFTTAQDRAAQLKSMPSRLFAYLVRDVAGVIVLACAGLEAWRRLDRRGLPWSRRWLGERDPTGPGTTRWLGETFALVAGAVAWSCLVLRMGGASPEASDVAAGRGPLLVALLLMVVAAPVTEELIYRLGVQGLLTRMVHARWAVPIAVVVTALLWSVGHAGNLRIVQLFPIGLALGWLQVRNGTEACIVAHAGFNGAMLALVPTLGMF